MKSWELRKQTTKTTERRVTELTEHMKEFGVIHKSLHLCILSIYASIVLFADDAALSYILLKRFAEQAKYGPEECGLLAGRKRTYS